MSIEALADINFTLATSKKFYLITCTIECWMTEKKKKKKRFFNNSIFINRSD